MPAFALQLGSVLWEYWVMGTKLVSAWMCFHALTGIFEKNGRKKAKM